MHLWQLYLNVLTSVLAATAPTQRRQSELWDRATAEANGIVWRGNKTLTPLPHETLGAKDLPASFSWCDQGLCTMSRNQHIPQVIPAP